MFKHILLSFACAVMMVACSSESESLVLQNPGNEVVEVSFSLGGDYVSVEETPMTRADAPNAKTLYAVQIYKQVLVSMPDKYGGDHYEDTPVAYGLFDNTEDMRISLNKDLYRFDVLILEERKDTVFHLEGHYGTPFVSGGLFDYNYKEQPTITNSFVMSDQPRFDDLSNEFTMKSINSGIKMASIDRYYASVRKEVSDSGPVSIDLDRYAFSITYNVTPPLDGKIKVQWPKFGNRLVYECSTSDNQKNECVIYNAPFPGGDLNSSLDLDVLITWERGSKDKTQYTVEKTINIKRKNNYTFNINMNARDSESSFDFNKDDEQFAENSITVD